MTYLTSLITLFCVSFSLIANASQDSAQATPPSVTKLQYSIIAEHQHKPHLFTQGLLVKDGLFYESSGLYNKSLIVAYPVAEPDSTWAKMNLPFSKKQSLPDRFFAEGMTLLNDKLYLLTWQEGTLFVYDPKTFSLINTIYYQGEGWGLATDGKQLIRSDGSDTLYFHEPNTFSTTKTIKVTFNNQPIFKLNELEFAEGFIWANLWHDNRILKIDPQNGQVLGVLDVSEITQKLALDNSESVLNGIAYDANKKAFWITGKLWPRMYLIKLNAH